MPLWLDLFGVFAFEAIVSEMLSWLVPSFVSQHIHCRYTTSPVRAVLLILYSAAVWVRASGELLGCFKRRILYVQVGII